MAGQRCAKQLRPIALAAERIFAGQTPSNWPKLKRQPPVRWRPKSAAAVAMAATSTHIHEKRQQLCLGQKSCGSLSKGISPSKIPSLCWRGRWVGAPVINNLSGSQPVRRYTYCALLLPPTKYLYEYNLWFEPRCDKLREFRSRRSKRNFGRGSERNLVWRGRNVCATKSRVRWCESALWLYYIL